MDFKGSNSDIFVSTIGKDSWSGSLPEPNGDKTDGPLATIHKARDIIRERKLSGNIRYPVNVWIRGGTYTIEAPIEFAAEDSFPANYAAFPGETPVIEGGQRIGGWRQECIEGKFVLTAVITEVPEKHWYFKELFVNGQRRPRTRLPKTGFCRMKNVPGVSKDTSIWEGELFHGSDTFQCHRGDIGNWRNIEDAEVVVTHLWTEERMPIVAFDEATGTVRSSRKSMFVLKDEGVKDYSKYYVENVFEGLNDPGDWYLDRKEGKLYYLPMENEDVSALEVIAPKTIQFLKLEGKPEKNEYIEYIQFKGLTFKHGDWYQPRGGGELKGDAVTDYASSGQGAKYIPGAIYLMGARYCSFENCRIEHIGWYGIELSEGCIGNSITGNEIFDTGAGGIKMNGSDAKGPLPLRTGMNKIEDNHIHCGSRVFIDGMGIVSMHSFGNSISHNHIHDFYQTGISCGMVWGFEENVSRDNRIEKNHIHHIGQGKSSDMGGIYTLGVQPGTVIRGNIVHDIESYSYGGRGIYLDEGSSHILVENNICYNAGDEGFLQHFGRENIVRNNIFAFCRGGQAGLLRLNEFKSFTFERNILIVDGNPLFIHEGALLDNCNFISDLNLFWDISGKELFSGAAKLEHVVNSHIPRYTMEEMLKFGYDKHSIVADPCVKDIDNYDFTLCNNSSAFSLGFVPMNTSDVGVRKQADKS